MTQQVCLGRVLIPSTDVNTDNVSMHFTVEATGSDANLDFNTSITPQTAIETFFQATRTGQTFAVQAYMPATLSAVTNACSISWTDVTSHLDGSAAGSPFRVDNWTLTPGAQTPIPPGISLGLAYRADYGTAIEHGPMAEIPSTDDAIDQGAPATHMGRLRPRSYLRGRLYLGPLTSEAYAGSSSGTPGTQFKTDASIALNHLLETQNNGLANQFNVVVWSRRNQSVNAARWYYINEGFTYQRRRGDSTQERVHNWVAVT